MLLPSTSRLRSRSTLTRSWYRLLLPALALFGYQQLVAAPVQAQQTAPTALKTIVANIDAAASQRKIAELSNYYSPNFSTSDGLNKAAWQQSLQRFWQGYNQLSYSTNIKSWKAQGNGYVANTLTKITGVQQVNGRTYNLLATIESQQQIVGGRVAQQQVLQERTMLTSGDKPPTIELNLPTKLQTNAEYHLDAIVTEPLGEDVLLGAALEQPVSAASYAQPAAKYKLELLTAGGLFKIARAPGKSGDYWMSTIFIRPSGMTTLTQRVRVAKGQ